MNLGRMERADNIARLVLCRAGMQNALVPELLDELLASLAEIAPDSDCRAVILSNFSDYPNSMA